METQTLYQTRPKISVWVAAGLDNVQGQIDNLPVETTKEQKPEEPKAKPTPPPTLRKVLCENFGIPEAILFIRTRKREVITVRQFYSYIVCELLKAGPSQTARHLGWVKGKKTGWDHATVLHSCKTIKNLRETDKNFLRTSDKILLMFLQGEISIPNIYEVVL